MNRQMEKARTKQKYTRYRLANILGITEDYVYQLERVKGKRPSLQLLKKIQEVFPLVDSDSFE